MSKKKPDKTLSMRILEKEGVAYEPVIFPDTIHDAQGVAEHAGLPPEMVYKTLVALIETPQSTPMLVMIAANRRLNLKKLARATGAKSVRMARHEEAERLTGLKVGGISALALPGKNFVKYLDEPAILLDDIVVSAGKRGVNLCLGVDDLVRVTGAEIVDVTDELP